MGDSINTFVDKVLIKHTIIRSSCHGSNFNEVGIISLMVELCDNITEINVKLLNV